MTDSIPALIPAAGRGTRLHPITNYLSKPMLPVDNRPLINFVFREVESAGLENVFVVVAPDDTELKDYLAQSNRDFEVTVVEQPRPRGLADALLYGYDAAGCPPLVALLIPDNVVLFGAGIKTLLEDLDAPRLSFAIDKITRQEAQYFGNSGHFKTPDELPPGENGWINITALQEKGAGKFDCAVDNWPAWRLLPRVLLPAKFFEIARQHRAEISDGEIDDVPIYRRLLKEKPARGRPLDGEIFDTGTPEAYLRFCAEFFRHHNRAEKQKN